jgi:hypothetical protein
MSKLTDSMDYFQRQGERPAIYHAIYYLGTDPGGPIRHIIVDELGAISGGGALVEVHRFTTDIRLRIINGAVNFVGSFGDYEDLLLTQIDGLEIEINQTQLELIVKSTKVSHSQYSYAGKEYLIRYRRNGELSIYEITIP